MPGSLPSESADSGVWTGLPAGIYTIRIKDKNNCIHDTVLTIYEPEKFVIDSVKTDSISCYGNNDGRISVYTSGGRKPYRFILKPLGIENDSGIFSNIGEGIYKVLVSDAKGCNIDSIDINFFSPPSLIITGVDVQPIICHNEKGSINVFVTGGRGSLYSISIDGGNTFIPGLTVDNLSEGIYKIAVKDSVGCIALYSDSIVLINPAQIIIDSIRIKDVETCFGDLNGEFYVAASGGTGKITYSLDSINFSENNLFTSLGAGLYKIYIKDSLGCIIVNEININQPPQLIADIQTTDYSANKKGTITINASGGTPPYQYSIDDGLTFTSNEFFEELDTGVYNIVVIDSNGCVYRDQAVIKLSALQVTYISLKPATCYGFDDGEVVVYAENGVAPYSVLIIRTSDNDTVINVTGLNMNTFRHNDIAGSYYMRIIDGQGRIFTDNFTITQPNELIINYIDIQPIICHNGLGIINAFVSGGNGSKYEISVDDGVTFVPGLTAQDLMAGTYKVVVKDSLGCIGRDTNLIILRNPDPIIIDSINITHIETCYDNNDGEIFI